MAAKFTVHAFGVAVSDTSQKLEDVLIAIQGDPLVSRNRTIKGYDIRVEHIKLDNGLWYLDFIKIRDTHGPGKGSLTTQVQGFQFAKGEAFCEETAVLFNPKSNHLLVQYNHYGVKYSAIEAYFSEYLIAANNVYTLNPKYDPDTERAFENRRYVKSMEITLDPRELTAEDRKKGTAVIDAIDIGDKSDAAVVTISVRAGRGKKGKLTQFIDKTLELVQKIQAKNPKAVSKINAGIVDIDDKIQSLDLIATRLTRSLSTLPVGPDKRWSQNDRYEGLRKVFVSWKKYLV